MARTDNFRRQHDDLLSLANQIVAELEPARLAHSAEKVHGLLLQLAGKIGVHLAMEDQSLYPRLLESDDPELRALAQRFVDEMGGIAATFEDYVKAWGQSSIEGDPQSFARQSQAVFDALADRIARENEQLYPLADRA